MFKPLKTEFRKLVTTYTTSIPEFYANKDWTPRAVAYALANILRPSGDKPAGHVVHSGFAHCGLWDYDSDTPLHEINIKKRIAEFKGREEHIKLGRKRKRQPAQRHWEAREEESGKVLEAMDGSDIGKQTLIASSRGKKHAGEQFEKVKNDAVERATKRLRSTKPGGRRDPLEQERQGRPQDTRVYWNSKQLDTWAKTKVSAMITAAGTSIGATRSVLASVGKVVGALGTFMEVTSSKDATEEGNNNAFMALADQISMMESVSATASSACDELQEARAAASEQKPRPLQIEEEATGGSS